MKIRRGSGEAATIPYLKTMAGRRTIRQGFIVLGALVVGYLISLLWLFPSHLLSKDIAVPRLIDVGMTAARQQLESHGMRFRIEDQRNDPTAPKGTVIWQDPPPSVVVPPNTQVSLILSDGPPDVPVPDVGSFPRLLAERVLQAAGFVVGSVDTVPSPTEPGAVVQTRPGAGVGRPVHSAIELVISSGPAEISVPSVVGLPISEARDRIELSGLIVGATAGRVVAGKPGGLVIDQRPSGATLLSRGGRVDLIVTRKGS
ncbi:MAG: PASTA domain-containing protein [Gemmatimonadales bacterium]